MPRENTLKEVVKRSRDPNSPKVVTFELSCGHKIEAISPSVTNYWKEQRICKECKVLYPPKFISGPKL